MITKSAFASALRKNLSPGKRADSADVRKSLQKIGLDLRFKGRVKDSEVKTAFEHLKKEGFIKQASQAAGLHAFRDSVARSVEEEAHRGLSEEQKLAHAKKLLRERMAEEEEKEKNLKAALGAPRTSVRDKTEGVAAGAAKENARASRITPVRTETFGYHHKEAPSKKSAPLPIAGSSFKARPEAKKPSPKNLKNAEVEPPDLFGY
jgi:hypothetical protein